MAQYLIKLSFFNIIKMQNIDTYLLDDAWTALTEFTSPVMLF